MRFAFEQNTPGAVLSALLSALLLGACAGAAPGPGPVRLGNAPQDLEPLAPGALRVRLVFSGQADLDLYVTDPRQETVYFANSPTRSGGELRQDLRCDAPAPRIEVVEFRHPLPGRYRIGVDYPKRCGPSSDPVEFVVELVASGRHDSRRGKIAPLVFQPIVLEVDVQ